MSLEIRNGREDESFIASKTVVSTTTLYRSWYPGELRDIADTEKIRGDLALATIKYALDSGFRTVVAERLSPPEFKEALAETGAIIIDGEGTKRSPGRRQVFEAASSLPQSEAIIWLEPEKTNLINSAIELARPIVMGEADLVVPSRNRELFREFYPGYMYESEMVMTKLFNRFLRFHGLLSEEATDLDVSFGPRVFGKRAIDLTMKQYAVTDDRILSANEFIDPEEYSNAIFFPVISALHNGLRVASVEIPFIYPNIQRQNEEESVSGRLEEFKTYRDNQRKGILVGAAQFLNYLRDRGSSSIEVM